MNYLRIGIVGAGNAGIMHLNALQSGSVPGARVTAVCCRPERAAEIDRPGAEFRCFSDYEAMISSELCDAVLIAVPHPLHYAQTITALRSGLHVFCEKPAGITAREAQAMAQAADKHRRIYALNFSRRIVPVYRKLRELIQAGTIGALRRMTWTSTSWLRVQSYYDSSAWRGTWAGEGGGLLLNQLPHVLDLWQWIFGMPARLQAHCGFGRFHNIEVEDDVTVVAEYTDGARVVLIGSTGEAPGLERIEIVGDRATILVEDNRLTVTRVIPGTEEFIRSAEAGFAHPQTEQEVIEVSAEADLVAETTRNFVDVVRFGGELIAGGQEGIPSLELANAILLSAWNGSTVNLPVDQNTFEAELEKRRRSSRQRDTRATVMELEQSFR